MSKRQVQLKAFREALQDLGWSEGRNIAFDYRWTGDSIDLIQTYAKELAGLAPDLLLTQSVQFVTALHNETRTIPILFGGASDPVEVGLADSLARPGGNVTGFMRIAAATNIKYLELIKELDPRIDRVLVVMSSRDPSNPGRLRAIGAGAGSLKVEVSSVDVEALSEVERVIGDFGRRLDRCAKRAHHDALPGDYRAGHTPSASGDLSVQIPSCGGRPRQLRPGSARPVPPGSRIRRPYPQGRKTRRPADPGADQV